MKISVCMASYNGEKYIKAQLLSIIRQLRDNDEIVIVDDFSLDNTREIIKSIGDHRIKLIVNEKNLGVVRTFEKAIRNSSGDIIFLSDQDDIWEDNKVFTVINEFEYNEAELVIHDATIVSTDMQIIEDSLQGLRKCRVGILRNIIRNTYTGCCMAFRRSLKEKILPIPVYVEIHDQWIGIISELCGTEIKFMSDRLIKYVRHGSNASPMRRRGVWKVVGGRIRLLVGIFQHSLRKLVS